MEKRKEERKVSTTKVIEIARNILKNKVDASIIAESTCLSTDEVNSL